jgi:sRNA-binding protein
MAKADKRHQAAESLLARLKTQHWILKHCRPLDETCIEADLIGAHPSEESWLIRLALHLHLTSDAYLQSLSHGGPRYLLSGETLGEVDSEARHHAHTLLRHHRAHQHKRRRSRDPDRPKGSRA